MRKGSRQMKYTGPPVADWIRGLRKAREAHKQSLPSLAKAFGMTAARLFHIEEGAVPSEMEREAIAGYGWYVERWRNGESAGGHWGGVRPMGWSPRFLLWAPTNRWGTEEEKRHRSVIAQGIIFDDGSVVLRSTHDRDSNIDPVTTQHSSFLSMREDTYRNGDTQVLYYNDKGIQTPLASFGSDVELRYHRSDKSLTTTRARSRVEGWGENQVNAELGRLPQWNGGSSIRVMLWGDELMAEGGAADFDYHEVTAIDHVTFPIERGGSQATRDLATLGALDMPPEAVSALARIAGFLGRE